MSEIVDVVNATDRVIGKITRDMLRQDGPLRRSSHVWFVTMGGDIIFQVRSSLKQMNPNMLDATVSGHVRAGETYLEAAIRETVEEAGIEVTGRDLLCLGKLDPVKKDTKFIDPFFRTMYMYIFKGELVQLKAEIGEGAGFESMKIDYVLNLRGNTDAAKRIVPGILRPQCLAIIKKAQNFLALYWEL